MQLDFQQLIANLEQLVDFMPIPHKAFVENYIKAYYLPESSMESWILQHRVSYIHIHTIIGYFVINFNIKIWIFHIPSFFFFIIKSGFDLQ